MVVPVAVFTVALFVLYTLLLREFDPFHVLLFVVAMLAPVAAVIAVAAGASTGVGIVVAAGSPVAVIVGFETVAHRRQAAALERALP
ncbi:hypothetical protein ADL05_09490 [Nocardiopsis sp. NRRL B-16309]|nr:hypothetical protein ADL05_09490 [Nocardiopsis sp. NRRL B-16309]